MYFKARGGKGKRELTTQHPHRGPKPLLLQYLPHNRRKQQTSGTTPARHHANRNIPPLCKIRTYQRHRRREAHTGAQSKHNTLRQQQRIVFRTRGEGHDARNLQERAAEDEGFEVACVHGAAGGDAYQEEEGCLERANPGDGGGVEVERGGVVGLEGAEGGYETPGGGDYEVCEVLVEREYIF